MYRINYTGKQPVAADPLSQLPLGPESTIESDTIEGECEIYIGCVMEQIPATKTKLDWIRDMQNCHWICKTDSVYYS